MSSPHVVAIREQRLAKLFVQLTNWWRHSLQWHHQLIIHLGIRCQGEQRNAIKYASVYWLSNIGSYDLHDIVTAVTVTFFFKFFKLESFA